MHIVYQALSWKIYSHCKYFILGSCYILSFCAYLCYDFEYYILFGKVLLLNGNKLKNINSPKFAELSGLEVCILCSLTIIGMHTPCHQ